MNTLITINYLYRGEKVANQFNKYFEAGNRYEIMSPIIEGYICDRKFVTGKVGVNDIEYTVNYEKKG